MVNTALACNTPSDQYAIRIYVGVQYDFTCGTERCVIGLPAGGQYRLTCNTLNTHGDPFAIRVHLGVQYGLACDTGHAAMRY